MLNNILSLKKGGKQCFNLPEESVKKLQLIDLQKTSHENLFASYMNRTNEKANELSWEVFMQSYTKLHADELRVIHEAFIALLGEEGLQKVKDSGINFGMSPRQKLMFWCD
ncbi:hypothetical protein DCCM_4610 [Desulfocucumis palustris]|uniref:Uncharacterized protein n=1 Tax=Desulfocucumis palustris TaxID=1898651 RepID=A0A2L2XNE1_9FIRM|nr:hypothetical protein [Desulfocucumis palustris]GBF35481.1 hypothetical protein DCCM_4610 [Desulfocucumis palustris]